MTYDFVVAQLGARQRYQIPICFQRLNMLKNFITDYWSPFKDNGKYAKYMTKSSLIRSSFSRWNSEIDPYKVLSHNFLGIKMSYELSKCNDPMLKSKIITKNGKQFAKAVVEDLHNIPHNSYFGFCSESLEALLYEKSINNFSIIDQYDCANDEEMINEEAEQWDGWFPNFHRPEEYYDRVYKEWEYADIIIVNSNWTKRNIINQGASEKKVAIVPLVFSKRTTHTKFTNRRNNFRIIYVGEICLRKGVQYLVEAANLLKKTDIQFILVGNPSMSKETIEKLPPNITLTGHVSFDKVDEYLSESDLFVFPTLSDGFGRVQLEAMSHGLPVIATPNCGEAVIPDVNGMIVPARNAEAIASAIKNLYDDREKIKYMSTQARNRIDFFSEDFYIRNMYNLIHKFDENP